jgi:succinoglycan biosynthesis protein ExoA
MKPFVSVIIPCRNEVKFLGRCLDSILRNTYPRERMEVLVADGMSGDGTRELVRAYAARDERVRLIDNPQRITPAALNRAIAAARGEVIVRVDAHSSIGLDYIAKAIHYLATTEASNVGGTMHTIAEGSGPFAEPIRIVLTHRFGVGNSHFRTGTAEPRWVDTVFGGCWPKEVFARIGGFNEQLARSQDMEFNQRLTRSGGKILLAPDMETRYFARADLAYFVRHNWANGVWAILPFAYTEGAPVRLRHLVPLLFVASLLASLLLAPLAWWLPLLAAGPYFAVSCAVSIEQAVKTRSLRNGLLLPLAFASLHWVYGAGSLWGVFKLARIKFRKSSPPLQAVPDVPFISLEHKETL